MLGLGLGFLDLELDQFRDETDVSQFRFQAVLVFLLHDFEKFVLQQFQEMRRKVFEDLVQDRGEAGVVGDQLDLVPRHPKQFPRDTLPRIFGVDVAKFFR